VFFVPVRRDDCVSQKRQENAQPQASQPQRRLRLLSKVKYAVILLPDLPSRSALTKDVGRFDWKYRPAWRLCMNWCTTAAIGLSMIF